MLRPGRAIGARCRASGSRRRRPGRPAVEKSDVEDMAGPPPGFRSHADLGPKTHFVRTWSARCPGRPSRRGAPHRGAGPSLTGGRLLSTDVSQALSSVDMPPVSRRAGQGDTAADLPGGPRSLHPTGRCGDHHRTDGRLCRGGPPHGVRRGRQQTANHQALARCRPCRRRGANPGSSATTGCAGYSTIPPRAERILFAVASPAGLSAAGPYPDVVTGALSGLARRHAHRPAPADADEVIHLGDHHRSRHERSLLALQPGVDGLMMGVTRVHMGEDRRAAGDDHRSPRPVSARRPPR
jgi:hypothetical protein